MEAKSINLIVLKPDFIRLYLSNEAMGINQEGWRNQTMSKDKDVEGLLQFSTLENSRAVWEWSV